jgi:hypothetical protein
VGICKRETEWPTDGFVATNRHSLAFLASMMERVMTRRMKDLVFENYKHGQSLAQGIREDEIDDLVHRFRLRMPESANELDLSSESLMNLHNTLLHYCQLTNAENHSFSDDENVQIVREITAYLGGVVLINKGGQWDNPGGLLNVGIRFIGDFEAVKGKQVKKYSSSIENLGYLAAGIWDGALMGIDIDIMQYYKKFSQKRVKEHLGIKKRRI